MQILCLRYIRYKIYIVADNGICFNIEESFSSRNFIIKIVNEANISSKLCMKIIHFSRVRATKSVNGKELPILRVLLTSHDVLKEFQRCLNRARCIMFKYFIHFNIITSYITLPFSFCRSSYLPCLDLPRARDCTVLMLDVDKTLRDGKLVYRLITSRESFEFYQSTVLNARE